MIVVVGCLMIVGGVAAIRYSRELTLYNAKSREGWLGGFFLDLANSQEGLEAEQACWVIVSIAVIALGLLVSVHGIRAIFGI